MTHTRRSKPSDQQTQILSAIRAGAHIETALDYASVDQRTFQLWLSRRTKMPQRDLAATLTQTHAEVELRNIALISKAAEKDWRAGAWLLEHRFPERWGKRVEVKRSGVPSLGAGLCMRKLGEIRGQKTLDRPGQRKGAGRHQDRRKPQ